MASLYSVVQVTAAQVLSVPGGGFAGAFNVLNPGLCSGITLDPTSVVRDVACFLDNNPLPFVLTPGVPVNQTFSTLRVAPLQPFVKATDNLATLPQPVCALAITLRLWKGQVAVATPTKSMTVENDGVFTVAIVGIYPALCAHVPGASSIVVYHKRSQLPGQANATLRAYGLYTGADSSNAGQGIGPTAPPTTFLTLEKIGEIAIVNDLPVAFRVNNPGYNDILVTIENPGIGGVSLCAGIIAEWSTP